MDKTPLISSAGFITSWTIAQLNEVVGLGIGVMTFIYITIKVKNLIKEK
jgi:hypothetical protein